MKPLGNREGRMTKKILEKRNIYHEITEIVLTWSEIKQRTKTEMGEGCLWRPYVSLRLKKISLTCNSIDINMPSVELCQG